MHVPRPTTVTALPTSSGVYSSTAFDLSSALHLRSHCPAVETNGLTPTHAAPPRRAWTERGVAAHSVGGNRTRQFKIGFVFTTCMLCVWLPTVVLGPLLLLPSPTTLGQDLY